MANLRGIPRRGWDTGFAGYFLAVPHFASHEGRAIYCDARQVFLSDPAELFDMDMADHAFASSPDGAQLDLMNCAGLPENWTNQVFAGASNPAAVLAALPETSRFVLPDKWAQGGDVADADGAAYLDSATAPWRLPVGKVGPDESQLAGVWRALEAEADRAKFMLFTKDKPTREFGELIELYQRMHEAQFFPGGRLKHHFKPVQDLVTDTETKTLIDYGSGKAGAYSLIDGEPENSPLRTAAAWEGVVVRCYDPGVADFASLGDYTADGVISTDVVEHLAPFDVPWVINEMFRRAKQFVFVVAACYPAIKTLPDGRNAHTTVESAQWWHDQMALISRIYPDIRWRIGCDCKSIFGKKTIFFDSC